MKSFGQVVHDARVSRNLTIADLSRATKIKESFLVALEKENWSRLPEYPVVQGFVRSVARALEISDNKLVAFLRRDYPPSELPRVTPKPDIKEKFRWTPKLTFILGAVFLVLVVVGYLFYQYISFVRPPKLAVEIPGEGMESSSRVIEVKGTTASDATVTVNNQPFLVDENGNFSGRIEVSENTTELVIKATSRSGKDQIITRHISVKMVP